MADARANILLTINSNLEGIRKAQEGFIELQRTARTANSELSRTGKALSSFGSDFGRSMQAGVGLGAGFTAGAAAANVLVGSVRSVAGAIKEAITEGVRFNATLEQSTLGVASVLRQFAPDKYRDFGSAMAASGIVIDQLKKKALETAATFEELLTAYQGTAGAMASAGIPLGKQVNLIVNISQAMAALGIRTEEMRQEATALMMGNIDRNARLAQTLGITADQIKGAREQGTLYEFLTDKLKSFSEAAAIAGNSITVLESNLKDARTQVAAEQTKELSSAYGMLLGSLTALTGSNAYKETLGFLSRVAGLGVLKFSMMVDSFNAPAAPKAARDQASAFREKAQGVLSPEDIAAARVAGQSTLRDLEFAFDGTKPGSDKSKALESLIVATRNELDLLEKEGAARAANNRAAADAAKLEALSTNLAREAAKAREEGVKKYADESEKAQARIRSAAKGANPAWYIDLLNFDKKGLQAQLTGPDSKPGRYLGKGDASDPDKVRAATTAAEGFKLEIAAKIAAIEKEIDATQDAQARKAKAAHDAKEKAEVRYLGIKAQEGTLDEKIAALTAEKAELDKTSVNFKGDELAIEMKIAKLKDDEAARIISNHQKEAARAEQAAINRIKDDKFVTERTKKELLYTAFKREQLAIGEKITAAQKLVNSQPEGSATRALAQTELDTLQNRRDVGLPHDIAVNTPLTAMQEMKAGLVELVDSFQTIGSLISDTIGTALQSVTSNITGLIMGTQSWGQALRNIGVTILTSVVGAIVQASVQWVARKIIEFSLGNTLRAAALAANLGTAMALSAMWATPAALATIATFGGAAAAAPAEVAGAMGAIHGMALFANGGWTGPGGVLEPAGIVHRGEVVFSQRDVARNGGVDAVENLRVRGGGYAGANGRATSITGNAAPVEAYGAGGDPINQAFFGNQQDAEQWLSSQRGRRVMTDFVRGIQYDL